MMAKKQEQKQDELQNLKQAIRSKNPGRLYFFYGEEVVEKEPICHRQITGRLRSNRPEF